MSCLVIDYLICGIASPVIIDSLAIHPPLSIRISHGTDRIVVFYYFTFGLAAFITF